MPRPLIWVQTLQLTWNTQAIWLLKKFFLKKPTVRNSHHNLGCRFDIFYEPACSIELQDRQSNCIALHVDIYYTYPGPLLCCIQILCCTITIPVASWILIKMKEKIILCFAGVVYSSCYTSYSQLDSTLASCDQSVLQPEQSVYMYALYVRLIDMVQLY